MKVIGPVIAALLLAGASDAPSTTAFQFRGVTAGVELPAGDLNKCAAKTEAVRECFEQGVNVSDAIVTSLETYYHYRLSSILLVSAQSNWATLRRAFIAKYGEPCKQAVDQASTVAGGNFSNIVDTWCFSTGTLTLQQYGTKVSETLALYSDANKAPPPAAKVNF